MNNCSVYSVGVGVRFIAPVRTELYKCNHASQLVHVGKRWCTRIIRSVHSVGVGDRFIAPVRKHTLDKTK
mgnify:FL=1